MRIPISTGQNAQFIIAAAAAGGSGSGTTYSWWLPIQCGQEMTKKFCELYATRQEVIQYNLDTNYKQIIIEMVK